MLFADFPPVAAPDRARERGSHILAQPHCLAHLADRHARAVVDHGGAQPGAVAAIALVYMLDHFLAPLMLEIDIDVGRLVAVLGDEAVEQQCVLCRIDCGDPQAIAHRRIGRAAAPLAQDRRRLRAGKIDNVLDGEEIAGEAFFGDQGEFGAQGFAHAFGNAPGIFIGRIAFCRAFKGQPLQVELRREAIGIDLLGIFVFQLGKAEIAGIGHRARGGNRMRPGGEQALHFPGGLEVPFGIGGKQVPGLGDGGLVPDRGHHIVQRAAMRGVVEHVVGGEDLEAVGLGKGIERSDAGNVIAGVEIAGGDVLEGGEFLREGGEKFGERCCKTPLPLAGGVGGG